MSETNYFTKVIDFLRSKSERATISTPFGQGVILQKGDCEELVFAEPEEYVVEHVSCFDANTMLCYISEFNDRFYSGNADVDVTHLVVKTNSEGVAQSVILTEPMKKDGALRNTYQLSLAAHGDLEEWFSGETMDQSEFRRFLMLHNSQHYQAALIDVLEVFSGKIEIDFSSSCQTARNYEIVWVEKDTPAKAQIPTTIIATIPVMQGFKHVAEVEFDVILRMPRSAGERILFKLIPKWTTFHRLYEEHNIIALREGLLEKIEKMNDGLVKKIRSPKFVHTDEVCVTRPSAVKITKL